MTATETNQTIKSLNYPSNYPHNLFCIWVLTVQNEMRVSLVILDFETEANYDKLTVSTKPADKIKILVYCRVIEVNCIVLAEAILKLELFSNY